jgi:hypothetical protein
MLDLILMLYLLLIIKKNRWKEDGDFKFIRLKRESKVEIFFEFQSIKLVNNFCENFYYNKIKICKLHVLYRKAFKLLNFEHIA